MADADEPFHVDSSCCTSCGVPLDIAPDLFAWQEEEDGGCRISRQPVSDDELGRMLDVLACQEMDCITYRGRDAAILARMAGAGLIDHAEHGGAYRSGHLVRDRAGFCWSPADGSAAGARRLAGAFRSYLRAERGYLVWPGIPPLMRTARFSWFEWRFHDVRFERGHAPGIFLAVIQSSDAGPAIARALESWLRTLPGVGPLTWYTANEWAEGGEGSPYRA